MQAGNRELVILRVKLINYQPPKIIPLCKPCLPMRMVARIGMRAAITYQHHLSVVMIVSFAVRQISSVLSQIPLRALVRKETAQATVVTLRPIAI